VKEGQDVDFTVDAFPFRTFHGKVVQVRNAATTVQNVVTYDTVIGVNNSDLKLKPGMTANVSIIVAEHSGALKIPNAALRFRMPEMPGKTNSSNSTNALASSTPANAQATPGGRRGGREGRGGGPGGGFGGGGAGRVRPERQNIRTVYVMPAATPDKDDEHPQPKPVQIKIGITDSIATEVIEGLNEGDQVVTGLVLSSGVAGPQQSNPFGGGFPRR
jgi:HlyD family secretion protein